MPTEITIATASGSSHDTVCDLIDLFAESLGVPVKLTTARTVAEAEAIGFNRLLLLGGGDIDPTLYGQKNTHSSGISKTRDDIECALIRRAMECQVPIMGICRGHQLIAAAHGGTLYQDFGKITRTSHGYSHRLSFIDEPLKQFMPTDVVNSLHHQSVKDVPDGFKIAAMAGDGIIEAIYKPGVLGVQFHPELLVENVAAWTGLFCFFLIDGLREGI